MPTRNKGFEVSEHAQISLQIILFTIVQRIVIVFTRILSYAKVFTCIKYVNVNVIHVRWKDPTREVSCTRVEPLYLSCKPTEAANTKGKNHPLFPIIFRVTLADYEVSLARCFITSLL